MTGAHTPGPWVIEDGWLQNERGPYADGQYLSVCVSATRLADGSLMIAAPDMLNALRLARPIVEADLSEAIEHCDADWEGISRTALDAIDDALDLACPTPLSSGSIER